MAVGAIKWDAELNISARATKNGGYVFALRQTSGAAPDEADVLCAMTSQDAVGTLAAAVCQAMGLDFGAFVAGIMGDAAKVMDAVRTCGDVAQFTAEVREAARSGADAVRIVQEATKDNVQSSEAPPAQAIGRLRLLVAVLR